jgi:hypothetical protein
MNDKKSGREELTLLSSSWMERGAGEQRMYTNCSEKWHSMRNRSLFSLDATMGPRYSGETASSGKDTRKYLLANLGPLT